MERIEFGRVGPYLVFLVETGAGETVSVECSISPAREITAYQAIALGRLLEQAGEFVKVGAR